MRYNLPNKILSALWKVDERKTMSRPTKAKAAEKGKRQVDHLNGIPVYCRYDEAVEIEKVTGHPRNPNKHGEDQIALLAKIIKASGWRNPICVSNRSGFVIKGHGRLMAARVLGVTHVPVEYQDYATEAEEYQDMIADNRIAELAERDMEIIKDLLEELDTGANDMDLTGYTEAEIERLMTQYHVESGEGTEKQINEQWLIVITCRDENHQTEILDRLIKENIECKALKS